MSYTEKGTVENYIIQELQKLSWRYGKPEDMSLIRKERFEEQMRIADILKSVDDWIELEVRRKERLERLKNSLMNLLLTGKVRVVVR